MGEQTKHNSILHYLSFDITSSNIYPLQNIVFVHHRCLNKKYQLRFSPSMPKVRLICIEIPILFEIKGEEVKVRRK